MRARPVLGALLLLPCACTRSSPPAGDPIAPPAPDPSAPAVPSIPQAAPVPIASASADAAVDAAEDAAGHAGVPDDAELRLERTACFGRCPVYVVTLRPDGRVTYRGDAFVRVLGSATRTVDAKKARALFERLETIGVWTWKNSYRSPVTDHPTHRITITWGGKKKTIEEYASCPGGAPAALCALEKDIDAVTGAASWTTGP